ncbi:hypothetical protein N185_31110 [Sinorhizobium sp. GW3]|nr:hypothetical protein N185_31110 [Sinorhizobium sp. GW3]
MAGTLIGPPGAQARLAVRHGFPGNAPENPVNDGANEVLARLLEAYAVRTTKMSLRRGGGGSRAQILSVTSFINIKQLHGNMNRKRSGGCVEIGWRCVQMQMQFANRETA